MTRFLQLSSFRWFVLIATGILLTFSVIGLNISIANANDGNNGTVKIHDVDTDEDDNRNEPHVCRFYIDGFNFDKGQKGTWKIAGQSPTAGNQGASGNWGPSDHDGKWRTSVMTLKDGHYKLTVDTGKGDGKHKVFWVDCKDEDDKDKDDDDKCPTGKAMIKEYSGIKGAVMGGEAYVTFKLASGCKDIELSLVSYKAPSAVFSRETAHQQVLFDYETKVSSSGSHKLAVDVPGCYFQVDFVFGKPIQQFGPADSNNFYSDQGRLIQGVLGGNKSCAQASNTPTPTHTPTAAPTHTPAPSATPTATVIPPTPTNTVGPNTPTPIPPTPTNTVGPNTPTPVPPTATATLVPNTPTPTMTVGPGTPTPEATQTPTPTPPAVVGLPPTGGSAGSGGSTLAIVFTLLSGLGAAALGFGIRVFGIRG